MTTIVDLLDRGDPGLALSQNVAESMAFNLLATKYFMLASFVILVWEHCITFVDEIERIWKPQLSFASILFILNRYVTLFQFVVVLVAFHDDWSDEVCQQFLKFPGALTLVSVTFAALIMILRTYALYQGNGYVLVGLLACLVTQIGLMSAVLVGGSRVPIPKGLVGCILTPDKDFAVAFWLAPLFTDTVVLVLTVIKGVICLRTNLATSLVSVMLRDGILYFIAILVVNLANVTVSLTCPIGLRALGASFSQIITTIMVARLQLNLRSKRVQWTGGDSHFDTNGYIPPEWAIASTSNPSNLSTSTTITIPRPSSHELWLSHLHKPPASTVHSRDAGRREPSTARLLLDRLLSRRRIQHEASHFSKGSVFEFTVGNLGEPLDSWRTVHDSEGEGVDGSPRDEGLSRLYARRYLPLRTSSRGWRWMKRVIGTGRPTASDNLRISHREGPERGRDLEMSAWTKQLNEAEVGADRGMSTASSPLR